MRASLKAAALRFAAVLAALGLGGLLVAASGIVPIGASSGHWPITKWFLEFSKRRSIALHSLGIEEPSLEPRWLVVQGAGHYEIGCAGCHGSPELRVPPIAQGMTPSPPDLVPRISRWRPAELFSIVKHGIKFTGMPAWPTRQRDDEVWAVVAFLRDLPELDAASYRRLVSGEGDSSAERMAPRSAGSEAMPFSVIESCARCHGRDGRGRGEGAFPALAGQRPQYLAASLEAYARQERHSGTMQPIAAVLDPATIREIALYYGNLSQRRAAREEDLEIEHGERIARDGIPEQDVPPCSKCHGDDVARRNQVYPRLDGQHAEYLALQLRLFKAQHRGGTAYAHVMEEVAAGLTPEQMRAVAQYYASFP